MKTCKCHRTALPILAASAATLLLLPAAGPAQEGMQPVSVAQIDTFAPREWRMDFISLDAILFDFDKAALTPRAQRILDDAARYILGRTEVYRILVEGYADSRASEDYNYQLAERRAASVRDYLAARGVARELFLTTGLGENFPVDEHWTREGRRRNRHVEVYIIERR